MELVEAKGSYTIVSSWDGNLEFYNLVFLDIMVLESWLGIYLSMMHLKGMALYKLDFDQIRSILYSM